MSLQAKLDAFKADFEVGKPPYNVPPIVIETMHRATAELKASGQAERALKTGDRAPAFELHDANGALVRSTELLKRGPLIVSFYRGIWCPYCNITLRPYQRVLPAIRALGAELVAISPERPDLGLSTADKNALEFTVLSDVGNRVARSFRLVYDLPDDLARAYASNGIDLPTINGAREWSLPAPAIFVIASTGRIALAHVEVDYRRRLDPEVVLTALRDLKKD